MPPSNRVSSLLGLIAFRYEAGGGCLRVYRAVCGVERLAADIPLQTVRYLGKSAPRLNVGARRRLAPPFARGTRCLLHGTGARASLLVVGISDPLYEYIRAYMRNLPAG